MVSPLWLCFLRPSCANTNTNTNTNTNIHQKFISGGLCSLSRSCTSSSTRASSPSDALAEPELEMNANTYTNTDNTVAQIQIQIFVQAVRREHPLLQMRLQSLSWNCNDDTNAKNDRPGDDGTLRIVKLLVFLLGVIDLASSSA